MVKAPILISAIIPVYNGERFIQDTSQSVLDPNHSQLQIVVIDAGSTDITKNKVLAFDNKVIYQKNRGPAAARNRGLQVARGGILAFFRRRLYLDTRKTLRFYYISSENMILWI